MVTRLKVYELALKELMRQWYDKCAPTVEESLANPHLRRLQKDIQYVSERIVELKREYEETCKIDM